MIPLLVNVAAVLFMTGFIWTMQLLHYPLLDRVGEEAFSRYETDHNRLFGKVAAPGVLLTLLSAVLLLFFRPAGVPVAAAITGLVLFVVIVGSTILFQAPQHSRLQRGFDRESYEYLLKTNWIRTAAWSLYSLLGLWMVWQIV